MGTISGFSRATGGAVIPGGAVGAHAVPGDLADGDELIAVTHFTDADPIVAADLTAEFSITAGASGSITNTVTDTSGDFLHVLWAKPE